MSQLRFDNRVAVVTGGGRGLGRAYAHLIASRGAKVVVNDTGASRDGKGADIGPAHDVVQEIKSSGGEATACTDSVATPEGGQAIIDAALAKYGRIDILIHSAGNVRWGSLDEMPQEDFDAVVDVHFRGAFHVVRAAFPYMSKQGYGRIVLTSSIAGIYGDSRVANYSMSKTGMIGLCNAIALEGAAVGIKCNVILPGAVTRMADGRDVTTYPPTMAPEMVAHTVGWLAHESCTLSGELYSSLGGRVARVLVAETRGVYSDAWTIEEMARRMNEIRDTNALVLFPPLPSGHDDHIRYSFEMSNEAKSGVTS